MDLFNKKKLKETKKWLDEIIQDRNYWENAYINQVKSTNQLLNENNNLQKENQKLIEWIEKIINEIGVQTKDAYKGQIITIPYYERIRAHYIEGDYDNASMQQKDIIIPSIRFSRVSIAKGEKE